MRRFRYFYSFDPENLFSLSLTKSFEKGSSARLPSFPKTRRPAKELQHGLTFGLTTASSKQRGRASAG
jgi:hypothetical protein